MVQKQQHHHHPFDTQIKDAVSTSPTSRERVSLVQRYNGIRPKYNHQASAKQQQQQQQQQHRVCQIDFPDPTTYGWTFTGSHQESCVEIFEKKMYVYIVVAFVCLVVSMFVRFTSQLVSNREKMQNSFFLVFV